MSELGPNRSPRRNQTDPVARRVGRVASDQWGVIHARQLSRLGIARTTVWRWANGGWLYEKYPNVYAVGHPRLTREGELAAALFFAGGGSALSDGSAARWWWLTRFEPAEIHITVPHSCKKEADGIVFHRRRQFARTYFRRLSVTTLPQTLRDYAIDHSDKDVRYVLAEAEYHHDVDLDAVKATCRRGAPGSAKLRKALALHDARLALTDSELERDMYALAEKAGVPRPLINVKPCGFRVDAYWPHEGVVVEVDGYQGHHTPAQLSRDHGRDLKLRDALIIPLRYAASQIRTQAPEVVADLRAAIYKTGIYQR